MSARRNVLAAVVCTSLATAAIASAGGSKLLSNVAMNTLDPTVEIQLSDSLGSGVYIGNGVIITAGHVVDDAEEPGKFPDWSSIKVVVDHNGGPGESVPAKVLWYSKEYDIAALHIDNVPADLGIASLEPNDAGIGTRLEVVGNPLGETFIHSWGRVAGIVRDESDAQDGTWPKVTPINLDITSGNSGGPAYIEGSHDVAGIVVGMHMNVQDGPAGPIIIPGTVNFMVPSSVVLQLLQKPPKLVPPPAPTSSADVPAMLDIYD